ncbi:response regulator [Methylobacterium ajmalii]|uniref:Response regulator n=1 Tax=Methylobacterium ajmalii TaxID=2738439 RepID=A0ABU9ZR69_9HYPH
MIRLLVVDDSALMRKVLGGIFAAEGDFELAFARDGLEALDLLSRFAPDVITLDVTMPGLDGLACLDRIMLERPCPVVMLSSLTAEGAEASLEALARGAVDVLAKPAGAVSLAVDRLAPVLVRKVRAAVRARPRGQASRRACVPAMPASSPPRPAAGTPRRMRRDRTRTGRRRIRARGTSRPASCWSVPRPAARRPSPPCSARWRPASPGRSWWPSTCRRASPGRWRGGSTGSRPWRCRR